MSMNNLQKASLATGATGIVTATAGAAQNEAVNELLAGVKDASDKVRTEAWLSAGKAGAAAVKPLARVMTDNDLEVARAAKRALWKIVRDAGRPGADKQKQSVETELIGLLGDSQPVSIRREVLWMLSEIGGRNSIKPIAELMTNVELREDARMAIERIPTKGAVAALKAGFEAAPEDFKPNIAQSLRKRGQEAEGYPSQKLVPTKKTNVTAL
jgi:HEAT repeat protein